MEINNTEKRIEFLCTAADDLTAAALADGLIAQGCFRRVSDGGEHVVLAASKGVSEDAVIVIISLAALNDSSWKESIAALPEDARLIPVETDLHGDRDLYDLIPKRVLELNFIKAGEDTLKNLSDTLAQDREIFKVKSELLAMTEAWEMSGKSEEFLIEKVRVVNRYSKTVNQALMYETDSGMKQQLTAILQFLSDSHTYAVRMAFKKAFRRFRLVLTGLLAAAVIVMLVVVLPYLKRSKYANVVISVESSQELAPIQAVKMVEAIVNPYSAEGLKPSYYSKLSEYIDMEWMNTPAGIDFDWALNDAYLTPDGKHIRAACGNGTVSTWDILTGGMTGTELSSDPISALGRSEDESLIAAADSSGYLYVNRNGSGWTKSSGSCGLPFSRSLTIRCSDSLIAVSDGSKLSCFTAGDQGIALVSENSFEELIAFSVEGETVYLAFTESGKLYTAKLTGGSLDGKTAVEADLPANNAADIRSGELFFADASGSILRCRVGESSVKDSGICVSGAEMIGAVGGDVVLCYSRGTGTHLYELSLGIDLGSILETAASPSRFSVSGDTVMLSSNGLCYSQSLRSMLPCSEPQSSFREGTSATSGGVIRSAEADEFGIVVLELALENGVQKVLLDPSARYFIGDAQFSADIPEEYANYSYYSISRLHYSGGTSYTEITGDGSVLLLGSDDGEFYEAVFDKKGGCLVSAHRQIPSRLAVKAVASDGEGYVLRDAAGTCWRARRGSDAASEQGVIEAVKQKLTIALGDEIRDSVSQQVLDELEVKMLPGSSKG